jgi:hypothetical protein
VQLIEMWGLDLWVSVSSDVSVTLIVGDHENDVGALGQRNRRSPNQDDGKNQPHWMEMESIVEHENLVLANNE